MSWLSDLFGGKKQEDPLAGVRSQLQSLASGVPDLVARQKAQIADRYAQEKKQGIEDIGEEVYGARGFGRTSIFDKLRTDLVDKLSRAQSADELAADQWGTTTQANILGNMGSMVPKQTETQSPLTTLLGSGIGLIGKQLGIGGDGGNLFGGIGDILTGKKGSQTMTESGDTDYNEDGGGFMDIAKLTGKIGANFIPGVGPIISSLL